MKDIEKMIPVKVESLLDLVKMAAILSVPHGAAYIIRFKQDNGKIVLGALSLLKDYYKYYGLPVFYYVVLSGEQAREAGEARYIILATDTDTISFSKEPRPGRSIPIITWSEKPVFIPELE